MISSIKKLIFPVYASIRYFFARRKYMLPEIMDSETTLRAIKSRHLSMGRYGDGEMTLLLGGGISFCKQNPILTKRLKEVIRSNRSDFLVGVPYSLHNAEIMKPSARRFWKHVLAFELKYWSHFIAGTSIKGDALISRFWMDYLDKERALRIVSLWKDVWNDRNVLIIEGENSRLGFGNDLFSNAKSIKRIECPSRHAFERYSEILAESIKFGRESLALVALGPTASVLAYDLCCEGIQAIDIGHIDVEYEWFKIGATEKVNLPDRAVNEVAGGYDVENTALAEIECQVVARIGD